MSVNEKMTALADAVRSKSGATGKLSIDGMTTAVNSITVVGGGGGVDTSDGNTQPGDVSAGLVFYNADGRQEGTMPDAVISRSEDNSKINITAGRLREAQEFAVGGSGGTTVTLGQVNADGNFQALAFSGTEASNNGDPEVVENYYTYNGVLPVPDGGIHIGGSADFYKCASVDTANKTWRGYKAILSDGVYVFENTVTVGLSYGDVLLPYIGAIYNRDASIRIGEIVTKIPSIGLLFYAPLNQPSTAADTGQTLNLYGSPVFEIVDGVPCATLDGSTYWEVELDSRISDKFTLSFWSRSDPSASERGLFSTDYPEMLVYLDSSDKLCVYPTTIERALSEYDKTAWTHFTLSSDGLTVKLYLNGVEKAQGEWTETPAIQKFYIATRFNYMDSQPPWIGHISSFRIYDRALSNFEVSGLASEFTPIR